MRKHELTERQRRLMNDGATIIAVVALICFAGVVILKLPALPELLP